MPIVISKPNMQPQMQRDAKRGATKKTILKSGIAATFRFRKGGETFQIIASTLRLKVWGWRSIPQDGD